MNSSKIYQKIVVFFYSSVFRSGISGEQQMGSIISWWIGELLGRAGFEPA